MDVFGVDIIRYISRGSGLNHHYVYEIKVGTSYSIFTTIWTLLITQMIILLKYLSYLPY